MTTTETTVLGVMIGSIASFVIIFALLAFRQSNEVVIARRCIWWARLSIVPVAACHAIQLNLDTTYYFGDYITLPSVTTIRPLIGLVLCFLAYFINSHFALRWLVVALQPAFIICSLFTAAYTRVLIDCRSAGTCLIQSGISLQELLVYESIQYAGAFFDLWLVLITAYLLFVMGVCESRYSVRLFSLEVGLRGLVSRRTGSAFERPAADPQDVVGRLGERQTLNVHRRTSWNADIAQRATSSTGT